MKKLLIFTLIMCGIISCQENVPYEEIISPRVFVDLKIVNPPKPSYRIGEIPNFDDLEVWEVFSDGYEKKSSSVEIRWTGNDNLFRAGIKSILTIKARDKEVKYDIVTENKLVDTGLPVVYIETEESQTIRSKDIYVNGRMTITEYNSVSYSNTIRIRGRGHATWTYPKKPYKIKLNSNANLLAMGVSKDWVLLANYCDKTLMRTSIAFKLSELLGFPWTPKARFVELVINGEYIGNYQLVESIAQGPTRVNIPANGFIVERNGYYLEEPAWFTTPRGYGYTFKNPDTDVLTASQLNYIKNYITEFETILDSQSFKDADKGYSKYIHIESFARWFLLHQMIANIDTNPYIVKEDMTAASKLSMGPVWDFEWSLGIGWYDGARPRQPQYFVHYTDFYFKRLLQDAVFANKVKEMWEVCNSDVTRDILQHISDVQNEIMESQKLNFKRWDIMNIKVAVGGIPMGSFEKEVECDRQFFINRMNWLGTVIHNSAYP